MKIIKVSHNRYVKIKDEITTSLIEEIENIHEIIKKNSDGENAHNHNNIYYTEDEVDILLKNYSLKKHNHLTTHYTKEEVLLIINNAIKENKDSDEIFISESSPQNNEKIWFRIIH